jgi:hypothetical protein
MSEGYKVSFHPQRGWRWWRLWPWRNRDATEMGYAFGECGVRDATDAEMVQIKLIEAAENQSQIAPEALAEFRRLAAEKYDA